MLTREEIEFARSLNESDLEEFLSTIPQDEFDSIVSQILDDDGVESCRQVDNYAARQSARNAAINRARTAAGQEIGPLPEPLNNDRRERCRTNLRDFALTYFHAACFRGLAPYQNEMVAAFQTVIMNGGKKARAVRRGGLKSTLARIAVAWAILYGHRKFVVLVGASDDKSNEHRDNFFDMLKSSVELQEDFPELIPLIMKRTNPKRVLRLNGDVLNVNAKDDRGSILFAEIAGVPSSGSRVAPYSMQSTDISGLSFIDDSGKVIRPDLLVFDDVQTPQSAKSFMLTSRRENAICTTFMGLAGLGETLACIMVCTVREANDLTVRFCDRKLHPDWDGQMFPVLLSEPNNKHHWSIYGQKLRDGNSPEEGFALATAYYTEHQSEMDAGAAVAWDDDKEAGYISAIQWCMTVSILQPEYFRCELQQQGAEKKTGAIQLVAEDLVKRLSNVPRGVVPQQSSHLTAFVDSSDHVLWWMVCAWQTDFSGWIVDFGTWPDQHRQQFYKSDLTHMLEHELPSHSWEEAFVNAHNKLDQYLLGKQWPVEGGGTREIDLALKDWSDGAHKSRLTHQVPASPYRSRIRLSKGFAPKPGKKPVHLYGDSQRDRHTGSHWVERRTESPVNIQFDANVWKTNAARRLRTIAGAPSALMLPGDNESDLMLLAEHLTSETAKQLVYDGTPGVVYEAMPFRDNDWWDCLVGNLVAASVLGCSLSGEKNVVANRSLRVFSLPGARRE